MTFNIALYKPTKPRTNRKKLGEIGRGMVQPIHGGNRNWTPGMDRNGNYPNGPYVQVDFWNEETDEKYEIEIPISKLDDFIAKLNQAKESVLKTKDEADTDKSAIKKEIKVLMRTRDRLVRDLTPTEAGNLLVHSHSITPERRKALLFTRGPVSAYFNADEAKQIKEWIANEKHLSQDDKTAEHPKIPTKYCSFHGDVTECEHFKVIPVLTL